MDEEIKPQQPAPKAPKAPKAPEAAKSPETAWHETLPVPQPSPPVAPSEFFVPDEAFEGAIESDPTAPAKAVNAYDSCAWIQGPGAVQLLAEATKDLLQVGVLRGRAVAKPRYIKYHILPSIKAILLYPTTKRERGAVELTWKEGTANFNASDDLLRAELEVESGKRIRCRVYVLRTSKVGPALAIDMKSVADVRNVSKKRSAAAKGKRGAPPADDLDLEDEE